jgi:ketosteroid isomerase-like protein
MTERSDLFGPQPSESGLRDRFEALGKGDLPAFLTAVAPDAAWHVNGRGPFAGDHVGRAAIERLFAERTARSNGTYRFDVTDVHRGEAHTVVLRMTHVDAATSFRGAAVTVVHASGGVVTAAWEYDFDPGAADAAWGPAAVR